eukprot:4713824-Ditylum_brightwellii.AAC.1
MNLIKDKESTTEDISPINKAFDPVVGAINGKTTQQTPTPVTSPVITISDKLMSVNEQAMLSIDGLTVNLVKFEQLFHMAYKTGQQNTCPNQSWRYTKSAWTRSRKYTREE